MYANHNILLVLIFTFCFLREFLYEVTVLKFELTQSLLRSFDILTRPSAKAILAFLTQQLTFRFFNF